MRVLPSGTLSQTLDLTKFRHGECDINNDSGRSGIDSTWRGRGRRGEYSIYSRRRLLTVDRTMQLCIQRVGRLGVRSFVPRVPSAWT